MVKFDPHLEAGNEKQSTSAHEAMKLSLDALAQIVKKNGAQEKIIDEDVSLRTKVVTASQKQEADLALRIDPSNPDNPYRTT